MQTGRHEGRLTNALLAEDHLHIGENGKFNANRHLIAYLRLKDLLHLAPDRAAGRPSVQGH